jgi:acyl-CoA synthetase (NDP forming)
LLANQPPPAGDRVAIVTNAGGLAILCADACEAHGLLVPQLSDATIAELRSFLSGEASVSNPVDMIASATPEDYQRAIEVIARDPGIDAMIVIYIPPDLSMVTAIGRAVAEAISSVGGRIPVITTWMSARGLPEELQGTGTRIPSFAFPEQAAIALARAAGYGRWRERPVGTVRAFTDIRQDEAYGIVAEAMGRGDDGWLTATEVERLLDCYGLRTARSRSVETPREAGEAAAEIGGPVALKASAPDIVHKTEVGAVALGLSGSDEVVGAAGEMSARLGAQGVAHEGFLVQEMVRDGVEMLVGMAHDPLFGPVVAAGAGGTTVELLRDIAVRITPLTEQDAADMVRSLGTFPLLDGFRGTPKADVAALEDVILRVGALADNHPGIAEMDCNPVSVLPAGEGAVVVDARVRVQEPPPPKPLAGLGG